MKGGGTIPGWPMALRREKAAAYLDVSPSTFDAAVKEGAITAGIVIFRNVRVWHRSDLDAFLEDRRAAANTAVNEWDAPA